MQLLTLSPARSHFPPDSHNYYCCTPFLASRTVFICPGNDSVWDAPRYMGGLGS